MHADRSSWSGRVGFVLAAVGSAIGLGNVWRFAYVAGENGGGAFLLAYAFAVVAVGLPLLLAEFALGARSRGDLLAAFRAPGLARGWRAAGWAAALVAFAILSYYSVVAGWVCRYLYGYASGSLADLPREELPAAWRAFVTDPLSPILWHGLFLAATAAVVAAGVERGIERVNRWLMPVLGAILLLLAGYGLSLPAARAGLEFLFAPDWSALARPSLYLAALGQAFFSLGVAMGVMIVYAGYLRTPAGLAASAVAVAAGDTLFAVVAGAAIFPIVFSWDMDPAYGPALAFVTLPQVFAIMPGGRVVAIAFFFLLTAAALTSAVSLLEVVVSIAVARGWRRARTAMAFAAAAFVAGVPCALGEGLWQDLRLGGRRVLEAVDWIAADLLLPAVGIAVAVYAGRVLARPEAAVATGLAPAFARAWILLLRTFVPVAIAAVLVATALRG